MPRLTVTACCHLCESAMDRCLLCDADEFTPVADRLRDDPSTRVVRCAHCAHVQLNPLPTESQIASYYNETRHSIPTSSPKALNTKRTAFERETERYAEYLSSLVPPGGTALDIGCGYGWLLEALTRRGMRAVGVEPSSIRRAVACQANEGRVFASVDDLPSSPKAALVSLFFVLEHLRSPVGFLRHLSAHLVYGGHLVVVVPNTRDHLLALNASYRQFYWKRAHLSYFSEATLRDCLERAGYTCDEVSFTQRWSLANGLHWMLNNEPQEAAAILRGQAIRTFDWLERAYEDHLARQGRTDTLLCRARKTT